VCKCECSLENKRLREELTESKRTSIKELAKFLGGYAVQMERIGHPITAARAVLARDKLLGVEKQYMSFYNIMTQPHHPVYRRLDENDKRRSHSCD